MILMVQLLWRARRSSVASPARSLRAARPSRRARSSAEKKAPSSGCAAATASASRSPGASARSVLCSQKALETLYLYAHQSPQRLLHHVSSGTCGYETALWATPFDFCQNVAKALDTARACR